MSEERPLPIPDPGTAPYWEAARAHKLMLPRCTACEKFHFYPRTLCPHCGSDAIEWVPSSGHGRVYSFTIVHRPPSAAFKPQVPYVVAIIALDEGPHLMSNVRACPLESVKIGMDVKVAWENVDETTALPYFVPI
jgi:uncharacterized OB-fold protein